MILFFVQLPSIWTPEKPKDSRFHPEHHSRASSHRPGGWLGRLKRMSEEEGLITESAEEQSGVRPLCL